VRCANLGVSCWIDPTGRLDDETQSRLATGDAAAIRFRVDTIPVPAAAAAPAPYTRYGDWLLGIPCAAMTIASLATLAWRRRRGASP
jgi:apolipoprotein N-acyltransferase